MSVQKLIGLFYQTISNGSLEGFQKVRTSSRVKIFVFIDDFFRLQGGIRLTNLRIQQFLAYNCRAFDILDSCISPCGRHLSFAQGMFVYRVLGQHIDHKYGFGRC